MASSSRSHWVRLSPFPPKKIDYHCNLMKIDSSHFSTVCNGIITYNINQNNWNAENQEILKNTNGPSCYDPISKKIYIPTQHKKHKTMRIFDIDTKKLAIFRTNCDKGYGKSADAIWMDSSCHVIGYDTDSNLHEIWDNELILQTLLQ